MLEFGNTLNQDQGLGVIAVSAFVDRLKEKMGADIEVEFVDGGALGLNFPPWVEDASARSQMRSVRASAHFVKE